MSRTSSTFGRNSVSKGLMKSFGAPQRKQLVANSMPVMGKSRREISQPLGNQSPDVLSWRDSLRSPTAVNLSFNIGRGGLTDAGSSETLRRSSSSNFRKSTGSLTNMNGTMGKSKQSNPELDRIESEYIKTLQQQVYFLELEANFLREQARKASEMHPQMTTEAERMLHKLRMMQSEIDNLQAEMKRKDSSIELIHQDKERLTVKMKSEEEAHQREKRLLLDELVQLKKEKDLLERDIKRKDHLVHQGREELEKAHQVHRETENRFQNLRNQLDMKKDEQRLTQQALEEKRAELLDTETRLRETEEKYFSSASSIKDKVSDDLREEFREEIRTLRQKLKEAEMAAEQDRFLRNKLSDDSSHLVKENALLSQQVIELTKQNERERGLRENQDTRRSQNIGELVVLKDREKQLQLELAQARELLRKEQQRCKDLVEQLSTQDRESVASQLNVSTTRSRLAEIEALHQVTDTENSQLRRDKMLLVDHVADIQRKLDDKENEVSQLRSRVVELESHSKDFDHFKDLETTLQSQKWDEFSRLAESMKNLSHSMALRSSTNSPNLRSSSHIFDHA